MGADLTPAQRSGQTRSTYSNAIGRKLVEIVSETGSVSRACRDLKISGKWTQVWKWNKAGKLVDGVPLQEALDEARRQYCAMVQDQYIETIEALGTVVTGDRSDAAAVSALRAKAQSYQWLLSKLLPRLYGDKVEHTGAIEHGLTVQMVTYAGDGGGATQAIDNGSQARDAAPAIIDGTYEESKT
jgi:hypothetical protein